MGIERFQARAAAPLHFGKTRLRQLAYAVHLFQRSAIQEAGKKFQGHFALLQLRQMISLFDQHETAVRTLLGKGGVFPRQSKAVELAGGHQRFALGITQQPLHRRQTSTVDDITLAFVGIEVAHLPVKQFARRRREAGFLDALIVHQIKHHRLAELVHAPLTEDARRLFHQHAPALARTHHYAGHDQLAGVFRVLVSKGAGDGRAKRQAHQMHRRPAADTHELEQKIAQVFHAQIRCYLFVVTQRRQVHQHHREILVDAFNTVTIGVEVLESAAHHQQGRFVGVLWRREGQIVHSPLVNRERAHLALDRLTRIRNVFNRHELPRLVIRIVKKTAKAHYCYPNRPQRKLLPSHYLRTESVNFCD